MWVYIHLPPAHSPSHRPYDTVKLPKDLLLKHHGTLLQSFVYYLIISFAYLSELTIPSQKRLRKVAKYAKIIKLWMWLEAYQESHMQIDKAESIEQCDEWLVSHQVCQGCFKRMKLLIPPPFTWWPNFACTKGIPNFMSLSQMTLWKMASISVVLPNLFSRE